MPLRLLRDMLPDRTVYTLIMHNDLFDQWPVRLADKSWLKVLLIDLLREKNIVRWLKKYGL